MAKVKVSSTFVGNPEEMEKYGGQVPTEWKKREKMMSVGERNSFNGKITTGTEMEVTDARAKELAKAGLIENPDKYWTKGDQEAVEKAKVLLGGTEKVKDAGPVSKAETKTIPTAKTVKVTKVVKKKGGK